MGRPERQLDPTGGPLPRFALELRQLRAAAGTPSYRQLAKKAHFSVTALAGAAGGESVPSLQVTLAYVEACGGDPEVWTGRWHSLISELAEAEAGSADGGPAAPYLGMATFEPGDAPLFFGRERLIAQLSERLDEHRLVAVFAPSGAGKSSLIRAGLVPALARGALPGSRDWTVVLGTPGEHPAANLTAWLAAADPADLIVVDQFEEVFTLCRDESERSDFIARLLAAAQAGRTRVVLGVRADFYARCAAYPALVAALVDRQVLIGPMADEDIRRVITGPAELLGLKVEPALVEVAVAEASGQAGALPLLSHALLETWRRRRGSRLTLADYRAAGGVGSAIARTAERVYGDADPAEQQLIKEVFLRLTAFGEGTEDTRRPAALAEIVGDPAARATLRLLNRLASTRLITIDHARVTVAHEALIQHWPRLRGWLAENREALRLHRRLTEAAAEWDQHDREDDFLYRGAHLARWEGRGGDRLNQLEQAYLVASRRRFAAQRRAGELRIRAALAALAAVVVVVGLLAVQALNQADRARAERDRARSRQLAAEARAQLQFDPERAVGLAERALATRPTPEAELVLRQAVADRRVRAVLPMTSREALGVAFSPDGTRLAATGSAGEVRLWAWTGQGVSGSGRSLPGHQGPVWSPVFSPDGQRLATGGGDGTIRIWPTGGAGVPVVLPGHVGTVWAVAFSPDGRRLASAGEDTTVRVWNLDHAGVDGGAAPVVLRGHTGVASGVVFSPDGQQLVSSSHDRTVRLWDLADGRQRTVLTGPREGTKTLAYSPDGTRLAVSSSDGTAWVWRLSGDAEPLVLRGHTGTVEGLALSPDGWWVATSSDDSTVRLWSATGSGDPLVLRGHTNRVWAVAFSPDGSRLVSAADDGTLRIWDPRSDHVVLRGHEGAAWAAAFTPDGQRIVSGGEDGTLRVWEPSAPRASPRVLRGHDDEVLGVSVAPDGRRAASGSRDGTVRIWDLSGGEEPLVLRGHTGPAWVADFSPNGRLVASAGRDGTLRIWDPTGTAGPVVRRAPEQIRYAAFSPDGTRVAAACGDGTVLLWTVTGDPAPLVLRGHEGLVWAVAFSPDGRQVASCGFDGTVRIWSLAAHQAPIVLRGHHGPAWFVTFSPDGQWVASTGKDGTALLWRTDGPGTPVVFGGFGASVETIEFSPDGGRLVTTHDDGTVRVWPCHACRPVDELLTTRTQRHE